MLREDPEPYHVFATWVIQRYGVNTRNDERILTYHNRILTYLGFGHEDMGH